MCLRWVADLNHFEEMLKTYFEGGQIFTVGNNIVFVSHERKCERVCFEW